MPNVGVIDLNRPDPMSTALGQSVAGLFNRANEKQVERQDVAQLEAIYNKYRGDEDMISKSLEAVSLNPEISNHKKVAETNRLIKMNEFNNERLKETNKALKEKNEQITKAQQVRQIEKANNLEPNSLAEFDNDPRLAQSFIKKPREREGDVSIDPRQLTVLNDVRGMDNYEDMTGEQLYRTLTSKGVSSKNAKVEADLRDERNKNQNIRDAEIAKLSAKGDYEFFEKQNTKLPQLLAREDILNKTLIENSKGATGSIIDQFYEKMGAVQYTSEGHRIIKSLAKDALKYAGIKDTIGSQISNREFDFFEGATFNPNFSKEANERIIRKDLQSIELEKLYHNITAELVEQNGGDIPKNLQYIVNGIFMERSKPLVAQIKQNYADYNAIQKVPDGKVLMFDKKGKPLHVSPEEVPEVLKIGGRLSESRK